MIELTQRDREKLAQAPIGRLALKRIEDLEAELEKANALVQMHRERIEDRFRQLGAATPLEPRPQLMVGQWPSPTLKKP